MTLPCVGEKRCLAHATSRKGVSSTEMLILWLPNAIFRSDIYISIDQQLRLDTVPRALCDSEYAGFLFFPVPLS